MGVVYPQDQRWGRGGAREGAVISLSLVHTEHTPLHGNVTQGCLRSSGAPPPTPHCPGPAPLGHALQFITQTMQLPLGCCEHGRERLRRTKRGLLAPPDTRTVTALLSKHHSAMSRPSPLGREHFRLCRVCEVFGCMLQYVISLCLLHTIFNMLCSLYYTFAVLTIHDTMSTLHKTSSHVFVLNECCSKMPHISLPHLQVSSVWNGGESRPMPTPCLASSV